MKRFLMKLINGWQWKWCFVSVFLLASHAAMGMPHPWLQQQNAPDRPRRVTLRDHKCVPMPRGAPFIFAECVYVSPPAPSAAGDYCVGSCYKGVYLESFKMCVFQRGSTCSAEEKRGQDQDNSGGSLCRRGEKEHLQMWRME